MGEKIPKEAKTSTERVHRRHNSFDGEKMFSLKNDKTESDVGRGAGAYSTLDHASSTARGVFCLSVCLGVVTHCPTYGSPQHV